MKRPRRVLSGILLMFYSSCAFSLMALCVKCASPDLPSYEIVFFRSIIGMVLTWLVIRRKKVELPGKSWRHLLMRSLSGFAALSLYFYTLTRLPLGTAVLLNYTSPIFATLLAMLFLSERPNLLLGTMTLVAFAGIYFLVDRPEIRHMDAVWTGLLSAVCAAVAYISIRAIKHRESPLVIILWFTTVSTLGSLFFLPRGFVWPSPLTWLAVAGIGIFSYYGQLWLTISLRRVPASLAVPFSYVTPLLSFLYGFIFWGDHVSGRELTGIVMIISAATLISWLGKTAEKKRITLPPEKPAPSL